MERDRIFYALALQSVDGIGCKGARKLIEHFGSAKMALSAGEEHLLKIEGIGPKLVKNLKSSRIYRKAQNEMDTIERYGLKVVSYFDPEFPGFLRHCEDAPLLLFYKGNIQPAKRNIISIVGTRKMTSRGAAFMKRLFSELEPYDPLVISGLAYGVDIVTRNEYAAIIIVNDLQTAQSAEHIRCIGIAGQQVERNEVKLSSGYRHILDVVYRGFQGKC